MFFPIRTHSCFNRALIELKLKRPIRDRVKLFDQNRVLKSLRDFEFMLSCKRNIT